MIEWLFSFLVTFNAVIFVPMLISIHAENLRLRQIVSNYQRQYNTPAQQPGKEQV